MMRNFLFFIFIFLGYLSTAQVTTNPKIKRKSTNDVFISKIEILEDKTVVSFYYVSKSPKENLREYLKENPDIADQLRMMDPFTRNMLIQQYLGSMGGSTISFQPSSFIKTTDGKKYKFLKAVSIPTAPERKEIELGKRYNFKVYFEKIPKGKENIDIIENKTDRTNDYTFWNFEGIKINNPDNPETPKSKPDDILIEKEEEEAEEVIVLKENTLSGKVLDANTNAPISAKIICKAGNVIIDSVQTSKSGYYEFIIGKDDNIEYEVSAKGYEQLIESFDIKALRKKENIEKNIRLDPTREPIVEKAPEPIIKKQEPIIVEETPNEKPELEPVGVPTANKEAFKLDKVYFKLGDAVLLPDSYEQLNKLVEHMKNNPLIKIQVEGHTDNQGDSKLNKKLSLDRAYNVRTYLVDKGIDPKRIKFTGKGDSEPISANNNEDQRKLNRRVEYKIIE